MDTSTATIGYVTSKDINVRHVEDAVDEKVVEYGSY